MTNGHDILGIDHVQLAAPNDCEAEARWFFGKVLNLRQIQKPTVLAGRGGVWFQCGAQQLHIGVQNDFLAAQKAHPAFCVRNLEALKERLQAFGVTIKEDEPLPGTARFFVSDPFGNRIEFLQHL